MHTAKITFKNYGTETRPLVRLQFDGRTFGDATAHPSYESAVEQARQVIENAKGCELQYAFAADSMTRAIVAMV